MIVFTISEIITMGLKDINKFWRGLDTSYCISVNEDWYGSSGTSDSEVPKLLLQQY